MARRRLFHRLPIDVVEVTVVAGETINCFSSSVTFMQELPSGRGVPLFSNSLEHKVELSLLRTT
jgi:hypothetical protein